MDELSILLYNFGCQFIVAFVIFSVLGFIGKRLFKAFRKTSMFKSSRFFNPQEYLPEEQISTIKQVFYLIMIVILVMNILYTVFIWGSDSANLRIFDILVSLYLAIHLDTDSLKNKFLLFLLIPFGSIAALIFPVNLMDVFGWVHFLVFIYFIKQYYQKFFEYTEENGLGITIILLFAIVFISFFVTIVVEDVSPLDSMVMVSNAFTSNGYAILGKTGLGKLNSVFLVWSGFLLSSVGTATLTLAIVVNHIDERFDKLEDMLRKK